MVEILIFGTAFLATAFGVGVFRRLARGTRFIDIPNERSSHHSPTLRGGGVAMVAVSLCLYAAAGYIWSLPVSVPYVVGAVIIAVISFIDDLRPLPVLIRFAAHISAACILVLSNEVATGGVRLPVIESAVPFGPVLQAGAILWVVWMVNAYNFMDGIDGIAGAQAVAAGLCWAAFGYVLSTPVHYYFGGIILFSALGFLIHNWRPATVFMGDVGSAFLGYTLAAMPFIGSDAAPETASYLFSASVMFLWMFVADSVYTVVRRALRGEKIWRAHREHVYQRLVIRGFEHDKVSLIYAVSSLFLGILFLAAAVVRIFSEWIPIAFALLIPAGLAAVAARKKH